MIRTDYGVNLNFVGRITEIAENSPFEVGNSTKRGSANHPYNCTSGSDGRGPELKPRPPGARISPIYHADLATFPIVRPITNCA